MTGDTEGGTFADVDIHMHSLNSVAIAERESRFPGTLSLIIE